MLTSFFSKSRPITFVAVAIYMVIFYLLAGVEGFPGSSVLTLLKEAGVLLAFLLSSVIIDFIAKRNEITKRNAYKTILFAAFACMLFEGLRSNDVVVANLFVLLALRRIVSLKSQRETQMKIFDATLWILVASLFYFWSVLFLFLVFCGIILHVGHNFKNWLVPGIAFLTVLSITTSGDLLINNSFYTFSEWFQPTNFDFTGYQQPLILIPVSFLLALTLWSLFFYLGMLQRASANLKASLMLVLISLFIALAIAIFAPTKNSSELFFFLAPLAMVVTKYFEEMKDKWFKEILLWLIVGLPILLLFIE